MNLEDSKKIIEEFSMLESSILWCGNELNKRLSKLESLKEGSPKTQEVKEEIESLLRKLNVEKRNIDEFFKKYEKTL